MKTGFVVFLQIVKNPTFVSSNVTVSSAVHSLVGIRNILTRKIVCCSTILKLLGKKKFRGMVT